MVPADSRRIPRVPRYSGYHYAQSRFAYRALTVCGGPFQGPSARDHDTMTWSYYPDTALRQRRFGLFPVRSPLLGESLLFSLPGGTKMFQFPPLASLRGRDTAEAVGCPIRKSAGQGLFAPNRGLSQLITSFIASVSQGIRHAPFLTFFSLPRKLPRKPAGRQLILSACVSLAAPSLGRKALNFVGSLQFRLSQYVKDRFRYESGWWRISDSNR